MEYYKFPLKMGDLIKGRDLPKTSLAASIAQNIYLILTSEYGELRFDSSYGCALWEFDFENIASVNQWREQIGHSVFSSISKHETRLNNVKVRVEISQEENMLASNRTLNRLKKCVDITVTGTIVLTNESFPPYKQRLYISPFSFD